MTAEQPSIRSHLSPALMGTAAESRDSERALLPDRNDEPPRNGI